MRQHKSHPKCSGLPQRCGFMRFIARQNAKRRFNFLNCNHPSPYFFIQSAVSPLGTKFMGRRMTVPALERGLFILESSNVLHEEAVLVIGSCRAGPGLGCCCVDHEELWADVRRRPLGTGQHPGSFFASAAQPRLDHLCTCWLDG